MDLREAARREHRPLSLFTVLYCWLHDLDGVIFKKDDLLRILGLEKIIRRRRVEWLKEDMCDFFQYAQEVYVAEKTDLAGQLNSFHSLWVSRRDFPNAFWADALDDKSRLASIAPGGPRIREFEMWSAVNDISRSGADGGLLQSGRGRRDERLLASYLSLLCQGLISPRSMYPLEALPEDRKMLALVNRLLRGEATLGGTAGEVSGS